MQAGAAIKRLAESVAINHGVTIVELGHTSTSNLHFILLAVSKVPDQGELRSCFQKPEKNSNGRHWARRLLFSPEAASSIRKNKTGRFSAAGQGRNIVRVGIAEKELTINS